MREKKYASDISREKFAELEPLLCSVRRCTKPTTVDRYEVFCAVLYVLRTGCQWRFLPSEWPKWQTVYSYFAKWSEPDQSGVSVRGRRPVRPYCTAPFQRHTSVKSVPGSRLPACDAE